MPSRAPAPSAAARTLHAFLVASTLIVVSGAFVVTRSTGPLVIGVAAIDAVALLVGISSLMMVVLIRSRLPPRRSGQLADDWWSANLARAVVVWTLLEFPAVIGAITLFVTRHVVGFTVLGMLAVGGLIGLAPARLGDE